MTPEEVVRAELASWDHLDVDEAMRYFTRDAVWENPPAAPIVGQDAIRAAVEGYVGRMSSGDLEVVNLAVAGNVVLTERVDHFEMDGQVFHARVMGAFEIAGGKIAAWRDYFVLGGEENQALNDLA